MNWTIVMLLAVLLILVGCKPNPQKGQTEPMPQPTQSAFYCPTEDSCPNPGQGWDYHDKTWWPPQN